MKKGDYINGYQITSDPGIGGGRCMWAFARKGGDDFFIKEFIEPKYIPPDEPAVGIANKKKSWEACRIFEERQNALLDALHGKVKAGGNLIVAVDFFRYGPKYYKVTEKVNVTSLGPQEITKLQPYQKVILLRTIAHSLEILHNAGIVHCDLKPDNILIKKTIADMFTTKLIDFDDSFFSGEPSDEIVADIVYVSPEVYNYTNDGSSSKPIKLTTKADVFSLGVIFSQYLTGHLPRFDGTYDYAWEAINNGRKVSITGAIPLGLQALVNQMIDPSPDIRPTIHEVRSALMNVSLKPEDWAERKGVLKKNFETEDIARAHPPRKTDSAAKTSKGKSKLRGQLSKSR